MPSAVPASTRLAAQSAAAKLRERADALHPDEDLAASIAANADAGDAFARGYGALKEIGLEDKLLDRFATENATGSEMRQAADVLDQLAQSEDVPGPGRKRGEARVPKSFMHRFRVAAILTALLCGLPIMLFGGVFLVRGSLAAREWWDARDAPNVVARPERAAPPAPALAPVAHGFEATKGRSFRPSLATTSLTERASSIRQRPGR